ncbi:hypothetical protein HID58_014726, partial [Brassica napus]
MPATKRDRGYGGNCSNLDSLHTNAFGLQRSLKQPHDENWNIRRCGQRRYPQLCDTLAETPRP